MSRDTPSPDPDDANDPYRLASPSLGATNDPKREAGAAKPSLQNISAVALYLEAHVMRLGAEKYGAYNWCEHSMKASTYFDAILRHLWEWWTGRDFDPESRVNPHAHIRACSGILLEQIHTGKMIDDRPKGAKGLADLDVLFEQLVILRKQVEQEAATELRARMEKEADRPLPVDNTGDYVLDEVPLPTIPLLVPTPDIDYAKDIPFRTGDEPVEQEHLASVPKD